jgi:hypothetical protein
MIIHANDTGTETFDSAFGSNTDTIGFGSCRNARELSGVVLATSSVGSTPDTKEAPKVGDTFELRLLAPHMLKSTSLGSSETRDDLEAGNPYWCGVGTFTPDNWKKLTTLPQTDRRKCGTP